MAQAIRLPSVEGEPEREAGVLTIMCSSSVFLGRATLLPAMTLAEALETTRLHRVAGRTGARTASATALCHQKCR
jgi:hypothetical protein